MSSETPAGPAGFEISTSTPAVVLKLDANVLHHGGLGVIRSLGRLGVPVYGVHESPVAPAARSRYLAGRWCARPSVDEPESLTAGLIALSERIGRPAVLLPTDDAGAIFLAEHGTGLRDRFLFADPPAGLPREVAGKDSLHRLCRRHGVPTPAAMVPGSWSAAAQFAAGAGFPVIVKQATPWVKDGGPRAGGVPPSTTIAGSAAELARLFRTYEDIPTARMMLQEFIPGGAGTDWFFHGYRGASAGCRPNFTGRKERSYPAHAGLTSLGRSIRDDRLADQATALLAALEFRGIVDLDYRWDHRRDEFLLLDFNPRIGAQFRLFRDSAGIDVAIAAYLDLTGGTIPRGHQVDRRFLVENYDPIAAAAYWRRGELGLGAWLRSLRAVDETAWFARDDLAPFGLMCLRMGWRAVTRPVGRIRRRTTGARAVRDQLTAAKPAINVGAPREPSEAKQPTFPQPRHSQEDSDERTDSARSA